MQSQSFSVLYADNFEPERCCWHYGDYLARDLRSWVNDDDEDGWWNRYEKTTSLFHQHAEGVQVECNFD